MQQDVFGLIAWILFGDMGRMTEIAVLLVNQKNQIAARGTADLVQGSRTGSTCATINQPIKRASLRTGTTHRYDTNTKYQALSRNHGNLSGWDGTKSGGLIPSRPVSSRPGQLSTAMFHPKSSSSSCPVAPG